MKHRIMVKVFFIILSCIVLLDIPDAESSGSSGIPLLSTEALLNADYRVPNDIGPFVRVIKGKYKWYQESEGGSQSITILDQGVRGDLNGDGIQDAVVLLVYWRGGTGVFDYLAAVLNDHGNPRHVSSVKLGDRVEIRSLKLKNGQITAKLTVQGWNDPLCCPTKRITKRFVLENNTLK